jgi:hypothetical protein
MSKILFKFTSLRNILVPYLANPNSSLSPGATDDLYMTEDHKQQEDQPIRLIERESLSRGLRMLRQQYAQKFTVPIYNGMWEKRGMFSKTIQEIAMREDEGK